MKLDDLLVAIAAGAAVLFLGRRALDRGWLDPSPRRALAANYSSSPTWTAADQDDADIGAAMRAQLPRTPGAWDEDEAYW